MESSGRNPGEWQRGVGDEYLNFWGQSYGSFPGQTYASLFPERVGAFVIDGVIDPIAWANVDAEVALGVALRSAVGAQATLEEFPGELPRLATVFGRPLPTTGSTAG